MGKLSNKITHSVSSILNNIMDFDSKSIRISNSTASSDTSNKTTVGFSVSSISLVSANENRKKIIIINNSNNNLYLSFGEAANTNDLMIANNTYYIERDFSGEIFGIWGGGTITGNARIFEFE